MRSGRAFSQGLLSSPCVCPCVDFVTCDVLHHSFCFLFVTKMVCGHVSADCFFLLLLFYICLTNVFFLSCFPFSPFCLYLLCYLLFPNNSSPVFMVCVEVWCVQHPCSAYDRKYAVFVFLGLAYFINVTASESVFLPVAYFISSLRLNKTHIYYIIYIPFYSPSSARHLGCGEQGCGRPGREEAACA